MPHASSKKSLLFVYFWAARGFCVRVLNSRICQHFDVKTSTVTPTFYYFFNIFTCYISFYSCLWHVGPLVIYSNPWLFFLFLSVAHPPAILHVPFCIFMGNLIIFSVVRAELYSLLRVGLAQPHWSISCPVTVKLWLCVKSSLFNTSFAVAKSARVFVL